MDTQPVVVGVDGSPPSIIAAEHAAAAARVRGAPLLLVHGYLHPRGYGSAPLAPYQMMPPEPPADGEAMLDELAATLRTAGPDLQVHHKQVLGGGAAALVAESEQASLLVVGSRGHGGFTGMLLGSVSSHVVAHAHCPVLVVRPPVPPHPGDDTPVVVGVDGSPNSVRAVEVAADEAYRRGRPLLLVHAGVGAEPAEVSRAQALLDEAVRPPRPARPDLTVVSHVQHGADAATGLVDASKDAAVVVVGSRGRGGFAGLLLGSISQALVHHAHCPVLVVPLHGSGSAGPTGR